MRDYYNINQIIKKNRNSQFKQTLAWIIVYGIGFCAVILAALHALRMTFPVV